MPRYLRGLIDRRPRLALAGTRPIDLEARVQQASANPAALAAYRSVCGFLPGESMPPTYPHILAAGVHLAMLGSRVFPVRLAGLIHLANKIELLEPIPVHAALSLFCTLTGPEETSRGQEFSLTTTARRRGQPVWRETMRFLARAPGRRERTGRRKLQGPPEDTVTVACWGAPSDIGRRYAQVSGDFNPIHLFAGTARLFGFDRAIAHGMWSLARATAALAPDAGCETLVVDARFVKPLTLPGEVELAVTDPSGGAARQFWLAGASGGPVHLAGTLVCDKPPGRRDSAKPARDTAGVS